MCWTDLPRCQEGIRLQRSHPFLCLPVGQGLSSCGAPDCVVVRPHLHRMQMQSLSCSHGLCSYVSQAGGNPQVQCPDSSTSTTQEHHRVACLQGVNLASQAWAARWHLPCCPTDSLKTFSAQL